MDGASFSHDWSSPGEDLSLSRPKPEFRANAKWDKSRKGHVNFLHPFLLAKVGFLSPQRRRAPDALSLWQQDPWSVGGQCGWDILEHVLSVWLHFLIFSLFRCFMSSFDWLAVATVLCALSLPHGRFMLIRDLHYLDLAFCKQCCGCRKSLCHPTLRFLKKPISFNKTGCYVYIKVLHSISTSSCALPDILTFFFRLTRFSDCGLYVVSNWLCWPFNTFDSHERPQNQLSWTNPERQGHPSTFGLTLWNFVTNVNLCFVFRPLLTPCISPNVTLIFILLSQLIRHHNLF